jgi:cysteine desulfurase
MNVYLDNNRLTPVDPQVKAAMEPFLDEVHGALNAPHWAGARSRKAYNTALEKCYAALHAGEKDTIFFTSGAAEANVTLLMNLYTRFILTGRKNSIILSEREDPGLLETALWLEEQGVKVHRLPVGEDGTVDPEILTDYLTPRTALVSVTMVDPESGAINPIEEIVQIAHRYEVPVHSDATWALGKLPIDLQELELDYLSFSAETLHAPAGTGALYMRQGADLAPLIPGSGPERYRGGPLNLAGIAGLGKAVELAADALDFEMEDARELRDQLEEGIKALPGTHPLIEWSKRVPNTLLVAFEGVESEALLYELNRDGVAAYSMSIHPYGEWKRPPLVERLGLDAALKHSTVGFALSRFSTEEEIEYTLKTLQRALEYLRSFSPVSLTKESV